MALSSSMDIGLKGGGGSSCDDEIKTQFMTREGKYRLMTLSEYSRPNRIGYANAAQGGTATGCTGGPVKVSFVSVPRPFQPGQQPTDPNAGDSFCNSQGALERITFNFGREIFVYPYRGVRKAADLTKPIDKRIYKGTFPTCHDFGPVPDDSEVVPLVVGFSGGQIQLVDPIRKELSKLFNEERNIDKSRVTSIKWVPGSQNSFLAAHSSGCMYLYNYEILCPNTMPVYQSFKQGKGYAVQTCKTKTTRNPLYKWTIGKGSINEFAFSPCGHFLAVVSQDGFLRIFNYDTMEIVGRARSYFGGFLCVCWSPDGKYIVCGGEDDLITVYSVEEKRVVVRGQGHKSWVSVVAFDPYNISYGELPDGLDFSGSDEEGPSSGGQGPGDNFVSSSSNNTTTAKSGGSSDSNVTCYRFASVGQDTMLCFWDLTEDVLKQSKSMYSACGNPNTVPAKASPSSIVSIVSSGVSTSHNSSSTTTTNRTAGTAANHVSSSPASSSKDSGLVDVASNCSSSSASAINNSTPTTNSITQRLASLNFGDRKDKRNASGRSGSASTSGLGASSSKNSSQTSLSIMGGSSGNGTNGLIGGEDIAELGCSQCPRINEVPLIEPLVTKKVAQERLTALVFREECFVTACQDGYVCTWARPGKVNGNIHNVMYPNSPQTSTSGGGLGEGGSNSTIV